MTDLFGRKLIGRNHEMRLKAIHGMAMNPNLAGVVLISLHSTSTDTFAEPIAAAGKDVECVAFQDECSTWRTVEKGHRRRGQNGAETFGHAAQRTAAVQAHLRRGMRRIGLQQRHLGQPGRSATRRTC